MIPARSASGRSEDGSGFLGSCLVESNRSQEKRDRRNKQRALIISVVVQVLIVAALVLFPLFSKGENIASQVILSPAIPYARGGSHNQPTTAQQQQRKNRPVCSFCAPNKIPIGIVIHDPTPTQSQNTDDNTGESDLSHVGDGGTERGIDFVDSNRGPQKPDDGIKKEQAATVRHKVSEPVQQAMLIHRVEPVYPTLALQVHREGRVQLHAIISTNGTIESLEAVSGDPMLIRSALDAVREWRYRLTILDGQAVEVETYITVIYTLAR